jgi:hypothetical protein
MVKVPNMTTGGCMDWPVTLFMLIMFAPVGVAMLIVKFAGRRSRLWIGTLFIIGGLFGAFVFGMASFMTLLPSFLPAEATDKIDKETQQMLMYLGIGMGMTTAGSLALFYNGLSMRKQAGLIRTYIDIVVNQRQTKIADIAFLVGDDRPEKRAMRDLQNMINGAFLPGYRIDVGNREIERIEQSVAASGRKVAFQCSSCGANNEQVIVGSIVKCEYCECSADVGES